MKLAFLQLPAEERRLYIEQAATRRNVSPVIMEKKTGPPTFPWPTTGPTSLRSFLSGIARDGLDGAAPDGRNGSAANVLRPDQRIAGMVGGPERLPRTSGAGFPASNCRRNVASHPRMPAISSIAVLSPRFLH